MNVYWPIYRNLEKELLALSDYICFDDAQNNVYSIHIADLLVRTAIEIEAISKHLYRLNNGDMHPLDATGKERTLFFDTDCIQQLDQKWHITKKVINVISPYFYFKKQENILLHPLKDCNKRGHGTWKKAYQAVKHNRIEALPVGNIKNLIRALGALYILNIYNFEDRIAYTDVHNSEYDTSMGSQIFSVNAYKATSLSINYHMGEVEICIKNNSSIDLDESVLIHKYTDESIKELRKAYKEDFAETMERAKKSKELNEFLRIYADECIGKILNEKCILYGEKLEREGLGLAENDDLPEEAMKRGQMEAIKMMDSINCYSNANKLKIDKFELVINKQQPIYSEV